MRYQPSLNTERLRLRPFVADDATTVSNMAGTREIAAATTSIPHPYSLTAAKTWIAGIPHLYRSGSAVHFAACLNESKQLIGCFALKNIEMNNSHAELECWIGVQWQRQGFATEAVREVLDFGFKQLKLHRIYSYQLSHEKKSAQLLNKLGLQQEGLMRQSIYKWGKYEDLALFAILAEDIETESTL